MPGYDDDLTKIVEELNRAAPGGKQAAGGAAPAVTTAKITDSLDRVLAQAVRQNASDVLMLAGCGVTFRLQGALAPSAGEPLSGDDLRDLLLPLLNKAQHEELTQTKSVDFCFVREGLGRFRANVHHQRGTLAASLRLLPAKVPTLEALHLPPTLGRLIERRQGLVLITGPTGSGLSLIHI